MEKTYMGLDVGNGTIKIVLIGDNEEIIDYEYMKNVGIIPTIKKGFWDIWERNKGLDIKSVGVTGAGRVFASCLIGGDTMKTEITAQAIGVMKLVPEVNTIFDLGKEDMKIICLEDKVLTGFSMNSACAGGCGTYLETIAQRFGIDITEYGDKALESKNPVNISSKCAVFGISSSVNALNRGEKIEDILAGVSDALVRNYIGMLGKGIKLTPPYVFVGGVSNNKAVIKSLNNELKEQVEVPKYNSVSCAYGMALLAKEEQREYSNFKGFELSNKSYETRTRIADGCDNHCELTELFESDKYVGCIGNKCEKCDGSEKTL